MAVLDALDRSLGIVYQVGAWRIVAVIGVVLVLAWWFTREGDRRAVELVKESARLVEASMRKSGVRAAADVGGALALLDASDKYEPNKARLKKALGGVDPTTYRAFVKRTFDSLL